MTRASIVRRPIDVQALAKEASSEMCGATAAFLGTVRSTNEGKPVSGIDYTAYEEMAEREMLSILGEAVERFGIVNGIIEHRIGTLEIGDASIAVVVSHPHRGNAMDALRYVVDETKARATIWKLEHYTDGSREWVGAGNAPP
jgi:molybdopterin synthase catalytic subunit